MGNINASVDLRREGGIAIVTADNPPVNALKHEVRAGLVEALSQAREDNTVEAVVIACAGRTFFAGADITEFGKPPQAPSLAEVIAAIEAMPKPVVAALHGTALGGGFELALACHFRVATAGARVGLPEVKLGLLPGAGGTQRLPRLIGPEKALKMIVTGDPVGSAEALADGIVDEIAQGDLTEAATAFARRVVAERRPLRLVRDRDDKLVAEGFADAAASLTQRLRGREAPAACVEAVRNAIVLPFEEGLKRESELFRKLVAGDQSKAQRHVFFAEREAAKVPDMPAETKPRPIASGAVIGAGTMGGGIAMCFANAGIPVTLIETGEDLLQKGARPDRRQLPRHRVARRAGRRRDGPPHGPDHRRRRDRRSRGRRCRDRSGVRGNGAQKTRLRRSRPRGETGRVARHQHLDSRCRRDRRRDSPAPGRGGHAFLQPGQCHAPVGDRPRRRQRAGCDRHGADPGSAARQGAGRGRRLLRICRQPDAGAPLGRGRKAAARRGIAATSRSRARRIRVADGAVRDDGPGRARCRLADPQEPWRACRDRGRAVRGRAFRPEDRQRVLPLPGRLARADPRPRGRAHHSRRLGQARHRPPPDRVGGDRRAHDLSDDQRRARASSKRGSPPVPATST